MTKLRVWTFAALAAAVWVGCGDDDDDDDNDVIDVDAAVEPPDASVPPPDAAPVPDAPNAPDAGAVDAGEAAACDSFDAPAATVTAYPETLSGNILAGEAVLDISSMDCAVEDAPFGVGAPGLEQVIRLENLVAGTEYGVAVTAGYDASFYVATACTGDDGPAAGECLVYVDTAANPETATFTQPTFIAPEDGVAFVVVDHWDTAAPTDGAYTLTVATVECESHFDCTTSGAVVCQDFACVAGPAACVGDDAEPPENDDDGPFGATALALDTPANANVCNEPVLESDFYVIAAGAGDDIRFELSWADTAADLDFFVYDATGAVVGEAFTTANPEVFVLAGATAGDYYVQVDKYEDFDGGMSSTSTAVTPYTLGATTPECVWDVDCTTSGLPVCGPGSVCVTGYDLCTGDDAAENDDDGAGLGTPVSPPTDSTVVLTPSICSAPSVDGSAGSSRELDWFAVTVVDGTLSVTLDWAGSEDLDVALFDVDGALVDSSATDVKPEQLDTAVTAGTYYLLVRQYTPVDVTAAAPYSLTLQNPVP